MEDQNVLKHIRDLVDEEHRLESHPAPDAPGKSKLAEINIQLDQCWDLLRQRRAKREFGRNPGRATVRSATTVEHYDPNARVKPADD